MKIAGVGNSSNIFTGQRRDFIAMRKDTFEFTDEYVFIDADTGVAETYDFTGCIGTMAIKKKKNDTEVVRWVSVSFDETEYTLSVDAEDMDMPAGRYYYDLQINDADGKMVTKLYGNFTVLQDITDFEETIEEEYEYLLNSIVTTNEVSKDKYSLVISSSVLAELITNVKEYNVTILGSSITTFEVLKYSMALVLNSNATATLIPRYITTVMLTSKISDTTYYSNEYYTNMLSSSIVVLWWDESEGEWKTVWSS